MVRTDARQRLAPFISVVVGAMAAVITIGAPAVAAPAVGGTGSFSFDEASAAVNIGAGITIAGGGDYGGKFIEFAVNSATSTEVLSLTTSGSPVTTNGSVSVVGSAVFLGNGTGADVIGRIDPVLDGTAGKALRVHFDVDFVNPSFETGDLTGWTALNAQIDLGVTQLAGCTSVDTTTYPGSTTHADNTAPFESGEFTSSALTSASPTNGLWRSQLKVFSVVTTDAFDVEHGPALVSSQFTAAANDVVYFDWRTNSNGDQPHGAVFAVDSACNWTELLEFATGAPTVWTAASGALPTAGTYRLVLVSGTIDSSGNSAAGASLFVDNIRVHGVRANDAAVQGLARLLHYRNTSFSAPATRTVSVTTQNGSAESATGSISIAVTPTPELPVLTDQTLASMSVGTPYSDGVAATGIPAATYAVTSGALPPGLTLDATTGAVIGTPTTGGTFEVTISASNVAGSVPTAFTLVVTASPQQFIDGVVGIPTAGALFIDGVLADGTPAPTYSVSLGSLPSGLLLDATTGVISGVATVPGQSYSFTIAATNGRGTISRALAGIVRVAPAFDDDGIPALVAGTSVVDGVHAGGVPAPTYAVSDGALPSGLFLDPVTGGIAGTPTVRGQAFHFTVTATNPAGSVARELTGTVQAVPVLTPIALDTLRVGQRVDRSIVADATPSPTFAIADGALPAGLTLDGATGSILGAPTSRGHYDVTIAATNGVGSDSVRLTGEVEPAHRGYLGLTPARIYDSRLIAKPDAGAVLEIDVLGRGGVPADATAVALNVAITEPDTDGFATVYPCGTSIPWASNINFRRGETVSNAVTSALSRDGRVCVYTMSPAHVVVDVNGAFSPSQGAGHLVPMEPTRLIDTREGGGRVAAGLTLAVSVTGRHGVPVDATAVVLNVAIDGPSTAGYATVYPCGQPVPFASNVNFVAGQTVSNAVVADIGTGGAVCIFTTASADIVVDVDAAYSPTTGTGTLTGVTPERLFDSRSDRVPLIGGRVQEVAIGGRSSVPSASVAVALNVAVTEPVTAGYVTAYPCGASPPLVANLNFTEGQTVSNAVTVSIGHGGRVCFVSSTTTHLVVDVNAVHVS